MMHITSARVVKKAGEGRQVKVILLSRTLAFYQRALSNTTCIIFTVFDVCNNAGSPLTVC